MHERFFLYLKKDIPTVREPSLVLVCFKAFKVTNKPKKMSIIGIDLCHKEGLGSKGYNKPNILHHQQLSIRMVQDENRCFPHHLH